MKEKLLTRFIRGGPSRYDAQSATIAERQRCFNRQLMPGRALAGLTIFLFFTTFLTQSFFLSEGLGDEIFLLLFGLVIMTANEAGLRAARSTHGIVPGRFGDKLTSIGEKTAIVGHAMRPVLMPTALTLATAVSPGLSGVHNVFALYTLYTGAVGTRNAYRSLREHGSTIRMLEDRPGKVSFKEREEAFDQTVTKLKKKSAGAVLKNCLLVTAAVLTVTAVAAFCVGTFGLGLPAVAVAGTIATYLASPVGLVACGAIAGLTYAKYDKISPYIDKTKNIFGWSKSQKRKDSVEVRAEPDGPPSTFQSKEKKRADLARKTTEPRSRPRPQSRSFSNREHRGRSEQLRR